MSRSTLPHGIFALCALLLVGFSAPLTAQVSGIVRDANTLLPIEDAIVTLQGTGEQTTTDAAGNYTLMVSGNDLVVVAAKQGYYHNNGAAPAMFNTVTTPATQDFALDPVPATDDPSYIFRTNQQCGLCHTDQLVQFGDASMPNPSPMAITGLNQWVYDTYNGTGTAGGLGGFVYTRDSIHAATSPNAECASCHQPQRWIANPFVALEDLSNPVLSDDTLAGVSCEVCHKIASVQDVNATGFTPGAVTVTRPIEMGFATQQVTYGPLGDVDFIQPNTMYPSYRPEIRSETCAVCHQYRSDPDNDFDFDEPGSFDGQTTYDEWLNSNYADPSSPDYATCADCHMPAAANDGCTISPVARLAGQIRNHEIRGTSPEFLENAATLSMNVTVGGGQAQVEVSVENDRTGHNLPTGINIRNMLLIVEALPAGSTDTLATIASPLLGPEAGVGDKSLGYFEGLPGKIYGRFLEDASGDGPTIFTDAVGERFNTRIPPQTTDTTNYTFELPACDTDVTFRARLIYRRAWRSVVDDKGWTMQGDGVTPLQDLVAPHYGHLMEEATEVVAVTGSGGGQFIRGQCNADSTYDIADAVFALGFLFPGMGGGTTLPCPDACDCNDDGAIDIADAVCLLNGLFGSPSTPPVAPHPDCGCDPTPDALDCPSSSCP